MTWRNRVVSRLDEMAVSAWFAYGSLLVIQFKVLWGIWAFRDLTAGDTANYYTDATRWADSFQLNPTFTPLYQVFYGSLQWVIPGPYAVTIVHRVLIVVAASLLVLAVLRRLLPPGIAWVLAVWWALLPVNYDLTTEVHLFILVPALAVVLLAASRSGLAVRSVIFGLLIAYALLVRQEAAVSVVIWFLAWMAYELWHRSRGRPSPSWKRLAVAFVAPVVAALALFTLTLAADPRGVEGAASRFAAKSRLLTCQTYAYGYVSRRDDFFQEPTVACGTLAEREFGIQRPTMLEAFRANPGAIVDHLLWNLRLTPYGLQSSIFGRSSGSADLNPDLLPATTGPSGSDLALVASVVVLAFMLVGLVLLWRDRRRWWLTWLRARAWAWLALASFAASSAAVAILIRPRGEYLYPLGVLIFAVIGACAVAIEDRWQWLRKLRPALPLAALVVAVAAPIRYDSDYRTPQTEQGRPLLEAVNRLQSFDELGSTGAQLASSQFQGEICNYLGGPAPCESVPLANLANRRLKALNDESRKLSAPGSFDLEGVDYVYVDYLAMETPAIRLLVQRLTAHGWERVGGAAGSHERWQLLHQVPSAASAGT